MLNLADSLEEKNNEVYFLLPAWKEGINKIKENKKKIIKIPVASFEKESVYSLLLKDRNFDCIIVDALRVSKKIMRLFKGKSKILLSLDNTGQGRFFSDILINILYRKNPKLKKPKIEINSFRYLILNKNFQRVNLKKKSVSKKIKKILITQGGSDTYGTVPKIINKLNGLLANFESYILLGSAFKHNRELKFSIKNNDLKVKVLKDIKNPWELFQQMDMAISGGGMTLLELLSCGIPCLALTQERKEMETINYLKNLGLIEKIGFYGKNSESDILKKTQVLINNYEKRIKLNKNSKKMIDGKGCERIINLIEKYFNKLNIQKI